MDGKGNFAVFCIMEQLLSYDVAPGSEIPTCIKIDKPLVVYRFSGNVIE